MKISYAITVCTEFIEIQRLIAFLLENKRQQDNIVVLFDSKHGDPEIENYLRSHCINGEFMWHRGQFDNHFADWKNKLTSLCTGDYIVNIDADKMPHPKLIETLPYILEENSDCEVFLVPRVNTVEGLTQAHIKQWGWQVNEKGWINWPDSQWRIYKRNSKITWVNKVHEKLDGFKVWSILPEMKEFALYHHKTIAKQEKQNKFYDAL